MAPELAALRVLLVHEWIYTWAGAERVLEQLVEIAPHADILAGIVTPDMRRSNEIARRAQESWVGALPGSRRLHSWFLPAHALAFALHDTRSYDVIISISHAFEKAIRTSKSGAVHISYCLSPPRYLWDLGAQHDAYATPVQRAGLRVARAPLRKMDQAFARRVDHFVSLSRHVADRVRRAYGRDSAIVYPPVARKAATTPRSVGRDEFLLTIGRLVPYKRVDLAIRAAELLRMRLVIAGDGPQRTELQRIAGRNVEFIGAVSEPEAARLLSSCAAFVFCAEEDFGIAPLEATAHGAPVVAYARGGALETVRDGTTGVLFAEPTPMSVAESVKRCLGRSWNVDEMYAHAEQFAPPRFRDGMREQIRLALERA